MTTHDTAALLYSAVAALRSGDRQTAHTLLQQVLDKDPKNEQAWLWMSGTVDSPVEQRECLEVVLVLNPGNEAAQRGLAVLRAAEPPPEPVPWSAPEPLSVEELASMAGICHQCQAQVYGNAAFCWHCHSPVHVCANCTYAPETECKAEQGITNIVARNQCPWWRPEG